MRLITLAFVLVLAGCASQKPAIKCSLAGKAEVFQGVMGVGVGQELADADLLCAKLLAK